MRALKIAAAGMAAQQMRVDVISNNLANMNTTGYNARRAEFADLHYQQMARPGTISAADGTVLPTGVQLGLGVRPSSVTMMLSQGEVYAYFLDRVDAEFIGQFTMSGFTNPKGLEAIGSNLFVETEASGPAAISTPGLDGLGILRQGYLEDSSVDPVKEITDLIEAQRGYELNSKVITAADQMLGSTVQIR